MPKLLFVFALIVLTAADTFSASLAQAPGQTNAEANTANAFAAAKKMGPPALYAFLKPMPKGADLHLHLVGAVYAETFIAAAAEQGLCVDPVSHALTKPLAKQAGACAAGQLPAAAALNDRPLYSRLIDAFSMRNFVPLDSFSGHDQFFATFDRFAEISKLNRAQWLNEVATRAAAQNEQYLEVMDTPSFGKSAALGYKLGWPSESEISSGELARLRGELLAGGLREEAAADEKEFAEADALRQSLEHCQSPVPEPACGVETRWLYQILRGFPPQQVFAQTVLAFEVATADPRSVVGLNFVMPEDGRLSMRDYHLQMRMLDYLHSVYPAVHISLHAGELAPGLVPPAGLAFHIREAIELGHAERIGHGVDVLYEDHPAETMKEMADRRIMVEVNLTSNDVILGVKGADSPLAEYRAAHVPVALSTDDEGVSRIDLTHEFVRGAEEQNLTYTDLKQMARTSLEHAFLPGESLYGTNSPCRQDAAAANKPSATCAAFLKASERAAQQWELERRLVEFESTAQHQ